MSEHFSAYAENALISSGRICLDRVKGPSSSLV